MNVVHVINSVGNGGAEAVLYRMVMHPSDDEHHVISLAAPSWYSAMLAAKGVDVHYLYMDSVIRVIPSFLELVKLLWRLKPNVIQTWMYRSNLVGGLAAKLVRVPVVWGIHASTLDRRSPLGSRLMVFVSAIACRWVPDRIINCSSVSAKNHEEIGYPRSRTVIVPNGLDTEVFLPNPVARWEVRSSFGIEDDVFLVGMVARWHAQKDHNTLFEALSKLRQRAIRSTWKCMLVGTQMDTSNVELLRDMASLGISDQVILAGARSDIERVMCALDVSVLTSAFGEALPNVIAESMACGTPCIVTDVGDLGYLVGDTGWVVPPRSPGSLAECITSAMTEASCESGAFWKERKLAARARIVETFAISTMYRSYSGIWSAVS